MTSHTRKNLRTSTTIFDYPEPSPARKFFDGCIWGALLTGMLLATVAIGYCLINLW